MKVNPRRLLAPLARGNPPELCFPLRLRKETEDNLDSVSLSLSLSISLSTITMRPLSPVLASLANVFRIPISQAPSRPALGRICNDTLVNKPITSAVQPMAARSFSTTNALLKRGKGPGPDKRVSTFTIPS